MSGPVVGQRVLLASLLLTGEHPGTIDSLDPLAKDVVTVKLDRQPNKLVSGVAYYSYPQDEINSSRWQICWPADV